MGDIVTCLPLVRLAYVALDDSSGAMIQVKFESLDIVCEC